MKRRVIRYTKLRNGGEWRKTGCVNEVWLHFEESIVFLQLFNVYTDAVMKQVKMEMGRKVESKDSLASYMQLNWFRMASWKKT